MAKTYAAISLHNDALRYLELAGEPGGLDVVRSAELPLASDGISNIMSVVTSLRAQVGKFPALVFGVPARETMLRLVEYPKMPIEEAKQAFQFDFDRHFTWSYSESAVDICEVESPLMVPPGKMAMLVAACRNEIVSQILDISDRTKMKLQAIEPVSVALLRALMGRQPSRTGLWYAIYGAPDKSSISFALVFNDNGVFYRLGSTSTGAQFDIDSDEGVLAISDEIQRTMSFVSNQFKNVPISSIILGGSLIGSESVVAVVENITSIRPDSVDAFSEWGLRGAQDLDAGFIATLGLCMRDEG